MNIDKFKQMLREDVVNFSFVKKDGTIREARGTTNAKYFPRKDPVVAKFLVTDVEYSTKSGSDPVIPEKFKIDVYQSDIDAWGTYAMRTVVESVIKRKFGEDNLVIRDFTYHPIVTQRNVDEDVIVYFDVDKSDWRSFRFKQLVQD
jgi:hypothetical protein